MDRTFNKLSAILVSKLSSPGHYGDGGGLWLQISGTGSKSWVFRFALAGKAREMGLGAVHTVSLAIARERARQCRLIVSEGKDPIVARDAAKTADALSQARSKTFDQCAAAYIKAHRGGWKSAKHAAQWESSLATYASPVFGSLPVSAVDTDLVVRALRPIWDARTETAVRVRGRIECILDWATVSKYRQGENPARWRGHLENLLANPNKIAPVKSRPALPWSEIGAFMALLVEREGIATLAVQFAILTACRSGEVRGARWSEIDLHAKLWTIPAARMKAGKEHRVPLSTAAVTVLQALPRTGDIVFPGMKHGTELSDMTLTAVLRRMGRGDITIHGFRSTFRDWSAEAPGNTFPREVCEHALAHSLPDRVEAAYRRGDLLEKRILLMQAWADYCMAEVAPAR
jgi:integrase